MKLFSLVTAVILTLTLPRTATAAEPIRAIYLFKDVLKFNTTALTTSNFTTLIIFGLGITEDGSIKYYSNTPGSVDKVVATNGTYVGGAVLTQRVRSLKTAVNSSVSRVEISMNSQNVRQLMNKPGASVNTPLAKNLAALRSHWDLDALSNNDGSIYDLASTVAFAKLVGKLGYKYTILPWQNVDYWATLVRELNTEALDDNDELLDRVYLQCYDGGAGNDPRSWWARLGTRVVPLVWVTNDYKPVYGSTPAQARAKFSNWKARGSVEGVEYWNDYDIEKTKPPYAAYGDALDSVFV
ncbi:hypothetical protein BU23DRAFT_223196 [Bimuria novae-zelandiae CBS 107.79]|uniref:Coagulation factor 5/8 type domain-containing protein n=1 Tax=Bimuria novae-zelandiae CBS 107.79 TaxID=1447943 RepID=A0A6A5VPE2_9PLEO|nr:hypothetical protein BU23DRAFT_223196 [Bimuria novae-zelandiae CBS 107.79]